MKPIKRILWPTFLGYFLLILTLCPAFSSRAQNSPTNTMMPAVTLYATDPLASWSGDTGTFTVFRAGDASQDLNIYYRIFGSATNSVDYQTISNFVQIPSGSYSNSIVITPINTGQTVTKEVTLVLAPSPMMPPVNYSIGYPSNATVWIKPTATTNLPPGVKIATPADGSTFYTPVNIPICAGAFDLDGYVSTVEFFAGTNSLGIKTNNPIALNPLNPFCLVWSNAPAGTYALTAVATDNDGATTTSAPVNIAVLPGPPPPPTNLPPVVRITSPPNGAVFRAPVNVPLFAYANDWYGYVTSVEFFAGTNSLGFGRGLGLQAWSFTNSWPTFRWPTNVFALVWSNAPVGRYALTAVATDNDGASTVSAPVNVTIAPSLPPPTNRPPIVSIIATDPVAIEGTNCWPWLGLTNPVPTWSNWVAGVSFCRFFTNCGPKNATFTVRRYGATNEDLTVSYAIGGSASNSVDYVPLPGVVTIPAGERRAAITIVPLDDGPPDITSTVVLKLTPGTNYLVGFPARAAAIILDGPWPRPFTGLLPDRCFHLSAAGPDGAWFHVEYSTDMVHWSSICTNQVVDGSIDFVDPDAQSDQARFYRAVPEAGPPPD